MTVDWTVTLGNMLTVVALLAGGLTAFFAMRSDIRMLNIQVAAMQDQLKALRDVVVTLARQDERLKTMEGAIEDLRHGRGFVFELGAAGHHRVEANRPRSQRGDT